MLKVALILGCLLSLIVATPMEHQRFARSNSGSNSNEVSTNNLATLLSLLFRLLATTTTTTTTTRAPTTTVAATTT
ncbi:MAP kinase phosphatase with leucine-rich repeats protein 3-like [Xiphophorus couchianus]|uniref:MAP kinase phosphatase with leucine-rich repeats protein 3-like n=1 Tax=Xiphophorus couchianus TaxID=32473 RepID=UPI0010164691|nr:MAP kinase phosphatase with leucine-rich repeats protein 3-like [Xiphophorus couchianus]